jgi:P-type conjugative transfer protein TrbJ
MTRFPIRPLLAATAAVALVGFATPAYALFGLADIVFDPTNYAQNLLTAERELQQINNEVLSLHNQAASLLNQARNLKRLPYSALAQLDASISQTQSLLATAHAITYDVAAIDSAFSATYPQTYTAGTTSAQMLADAQARWQNARVAFQDAMHVQAGIVQNLAGDKSQIDALISASQSADGILLATESGNQLMALQARQLTDLTAVMASIARAQSLESARRLESQEQAKAQFARFLNYGPGYVPSRVTFP